MGSLLNDAEIAERLTQLPGWHRAGSAIVKEFTFAGFPEAVAFVTRLVAPSEAADHHPDLGDPLPPRRRDLHDPQRRRHHGQGLHRCRRGRSGGTVRLKKHYTSREVAAQTGLSARQLQWWDQRGLYAASVPTHRTEAGGYTERRYSPIELLELMVLADLRRRGFSLGRIRRLLLVLRTRFKVRLFEAIEGGGPVTLFIDGDDIYARTESGEYFNVLDNPRQPLLVLGQEPRMRQVTAREHHARPKAKAAAARARGSAAVRS